MKVSRIQQKLSAFLFLISQKILGVYAIFLMACALLSCSQKTFDTKKELMTYISEIENGYTQQKTINGVDFSITYRPTDVVVEQMLSENPTQKEVDSLREKYNKYIYFNLSLSKNNQEVLNGLAGDRNKFGAMVNQLAFGMGDKVHLISKTRDTIEMVDYVYPRLYGMSGSTSMLFVYPRDKKVMQNELFHFTIEDMGFATGEVGFNISTDPIVNEPTLKL